LPGGTIYGIPGSILKNRFGEYPKTNPSVIVAGLMDTIELIPSNTYYSDIYQAFAELLLEYLTPWKSLKSAREYYHSRQFIDDMIQYARSSIVKASEVKSILDRHFYSHGELFSDENLAEIYGALDYSLDDINDLSLPDTTEELEELILAEQRTLFESNGTRSTLLKYVEDVDVLKTKTDI
jgi:hypothetical protein